MKKNKALKMNQCGYVALCILFFCIGPAEAAILAVPSSYPTIVSAVAAAKSGDTITIAAGTYSTGIVATIGIDNLTIRGLGGRAHLDAAGISIANGKAIFVTTGNAILLENLEFSHTSVNDHNGAGIRHEGGLLTIKNCYFHDNENGILTSNQGNVGELVVLHSEFNHNGLGSAGYTHNIYVGHIGRFTMRYSYSHHASHGHNVKSRAAENYILYNRIMDESDGNASYQIDLPNGGLSYIIGNVLHQGLYAENSTMISYAAEGAVNPLQKIYVSANTFVNDRPIGYGIRLSGTPEAVISHNIFDNLSAAVQGNVTVLQYNLESRFSGFINRAGHDFHIMNDSSAKDIGGVPGKFNGYDLQPTFEYLHPLQAKQRFDDGVLDAGAFEYAAQAPPPSLSKVIMAPLIFLLLH